ncbi:hypothetical protein [Burkholderia oklahomensis]|uniref:hypothetical protein n=1 Tax=Burkholderia oklahomensis TaxID=342113 RepID=UPI0012FE6C73|nr:hypothetical protein [Burkholderia oklahomensis]QPS39302.1 hypothetical protein I6G57_06990 [Burkholderia oklahomensis]
MHDDSPGAGSRAWREAACSKLMRAMRLSIEPYALPLMIEIEKIQGAAYGITVTVRHVGSLSENRGVTCTHPRRTRTRARTLGAAVTRRRQANARREPGSRRMPNERAKTQRSCGANQGCTGNGTANCDAHRLPDRLDGGNEKGRGRLAVQAGKLLEDRLLQVSKAHAPFVEMRGFYGCRAPKVNDDLRHHEKKSPRSRHCKFLRDETVPFAFNRPWTETGPKA